MKKRHRQHVNPLKMTCLAPREKPLTLPKEMPLEVDLGCGDGKFLIGLALRYPDRYFLGLDIREEFLQEGLFEVQKLGLHNLSLEVQNLMVDLETLFPENSVERFYLNFPDPWFKHRHQNRRWLNPFTLKALVKALCPQAEIFFQSDVWSLALDYLALLETHSDLENRAGSWTFLRKNPFQIKTTREGICEDKALPIWRGLFCKKTPRGLRLQERTRHKEEGI